MLKERAVFISVTFLLIFEWVKEHKQMKQKCRQSIERSKLSALFFCCSSEFYFSVKAHKRLSSLGFFIFKKQLLCYIVLWTGMGWTVPSDTRCLYTKSFEAFAALQKKQKLCSLCIKLVRCKSFVCSWLKLWIIRKRRGNKPGKGLLQG